MLKTLNKIQLRIQNKIIFYIDKIKYQFWFRKQNKILSKSADILNYEPLISIVVPVFNTPEKYFWKMVESVLAQDYSNWELILVDDASTKSRTRELMTEAVNKNPKIRTLFLSKNGGISKATNKGISLAKGEFVSFLDHDDVLDRQALKEVAKSLNEQEYDIVYTDEDKIINSSISRHQPFCKTGWNLDAMYCGNYVTHFMTIRKTLLDLSGGEDSNYDGAQDWELILRCSRNTSVEKIHHIPKILYSWRVHNDSTSKRISSKPYVSEAQKKTILKDILIREKNTVVAEINPKNQGFWSVTFPYIEKAKVCIYLNDKCSEEVAINLQENTTYKNYTVHNGRKFNYKSNDCAADYIVMFYGEPKIITKDWIVEMLRHAGRQDIGFVQARLNKKRDILNNLKSSLSRESISILKKQSSLNVSNNWYYNARYNIKTVETGCIVIKRDKLERAYKMCKSTDLSLLAETLNNIGLRNLYNPDVRVLK